MTRPVMHLVDPKTGESDPADIRRVFDSQLATSLAWRESTIAERIARLKKLRDAMLARRADFYAAFEKDYRKPAIEVDGTEYRITKVGNHPRSPLLTLTLSSTDE